VSIKTLNDIFFHATRSIENPKAFQEKVQGTYQPTSGGEFEKIAFKVALGLKNLGLNAGDRVALLADNCLNWAAADYGILLNRAINVPIYSTLIPAQIAYILGNSGARFIFCSDEIQTEKVLQKRDDLPNLEKIIQFQGAADDPDVISFQKLLEIGAEMLESGASALKDDALKVGEHDICSIIYTSGTTGDPKGVVLTHGNIVSNVIAGLQIFTISIEDTALSFLPLSHIFERMVGYYTMFYAGASIAYAESIDTVPQNLQEIRPTVMVSVPRLYEKMYARILDTALSGSFIKKNIFFWAKNKGETWAELDIAGKEIPGLLNWQVGIANKLVFSKLQARTGGRLRFFISGGAPLLQDIAKFFYAAGLVIMEGYGLTETSPVITANRFNEYRLGTVGRPLPGIEVKIASDGEILTRGPNVMLGYFNNPEATAEVMSEDGWFATGDIGKIDGDGYLSITDRKKDILVTAGGKNVAPQTIENMLKSDKFISQCVVLGDGKPFIGALIVPNFDYLAKYAKRKEIIYTAIKGLLLEAKIQDLYRRRIARYNANLSRYEQVKQFRLLDHELTLEGGEMTPSLKVRRRQVLKKYGDIVDEIYQTKK
jgi:long-chain acyl-CoA synthetase